MRGDVDTIKERLDIVEVISGHTKLEKAGASFKGRCPFHNEKTPSFFVSPVRQSYYCFGCGAKGDIFSFIEAMEGLDFRGALKLLAEKAGVEIEYRPEAREARSEKDKIIQVVESATQFFENELKNNPAPLTYLKSRGVNDSSIKNWRLGYAPAEWHALYTHLLQLGYGKEILLKAGLAKQVDGTRAKEPYDVFRDRIIFPLADSNGDIIAFSGRALTKGTEPKYLNSPDTPLFTKSKVLYGLDKAKEKIRRQDYTVLVEGQIDLVLSHQAGVENTVASSGTAFTVAHLDRLKKLSKRITLAFDGDEAGEKAAEKATELALALGLEVKMVKIPEDKDPADIIKKNPQDWKDVLKKTLPAIEYFFNRILEEEKDARKLGKLVEKKILPLVILLESAIERSHFLSLIANRTGIKEEMIWEDLKRVKKPDTRTFKYAASMGTISASDTKIPPTPLDPTSHKEMIQEKLTEIRTWLKEAPKTSKDFLAWKKEEDELTNHLADVLVHEELSQLSLDLSRAEVAKDNKLIESLTLNIQEVHKKIRALEENKKIL